MSVSITRICLVRHGETAWNADRRIQGQIDSPLNEIGIGQAHAAARRLSKVPFTAVYSSDLQRARRTAQIIAAHHALPVQLHGGLRERMYGKFQGLTYAEAEQRYPRAYKRFHDRDPRENFRSGESLEEFSRRVQTALCAIAETQRGAATLVVAHGGVLDIAYRLATGLPLTAPRDFVISNAGVSWIAQADGRWRLQSWNAMPIAGLDELPG
ncbi:MAG: Phosphoserine phosphatase 1 [Gammaproteobacteria bacterium]|nr:Phosphoserine phosphatase 1 [Gammaproteobacteria bacterium]